MSEFRQMRRYRQALAMEECREILERNTNGILSVLGDDGYPYGVPMSYVYDQGNIYMHCAKEGHKLDAIRREPKVSFTVIDQDLVMPMEYTTYFRSVIVFGKAEVLKDQESIVKAMKVLSQKYAPLEPMSRTEDMIEKEMPALSMIRIQIEHMSGKEAKELMNQKSRKKVS